MTAAVKLIAGLGNPGSDYEHSRHNIGFMLTERLAAVWGISFSSAKKISAELAKKNLDGREIFLLKPQTYMNASGHAVAAALNYYKIAPAQVLVIHDDLDLAPGRVKFKLGGGSGGHNGLKDIDSVLGTNNYYRLRLGIGHPRDLLLAQYREKGCTAPAAAIISAAAKAKVSDYVLKAPYASELQLIEAAFIRIIALMPLILAGDLAAVQRQLP